MRNLRPPAAADHHDRTGDTPPPPAAAAPAVIVHGLADALRALAPGRPLTLLSAPGAAIFGGCAWWRALAARAREAAPGLVAADILDCADATGRALAALRIGQRAIVLWPDAPGRDSALSAARGLGAQVLAAAPDALDMADADAGARLPAWLGVTVGTGPPGDIPPGDTGRTLG